MGGVLVKGDKNTAEYTDALAIINNWRSSHGYPLQVVTNTLRTRAKKIGKNPLIAQRLKRITSIEDKLKRLDKTKLAGMQDIGGCRVVLDSMSEVWDLLSIYDLARAKSPKGRPEFIGEDDYIGNPKPSGYRSIHLIMKFQSLAGNCQSFNGHKIEIQIRTKLQHAWATAVETTGTFLGQDLKSSRGSKEWLRFFVLASTAFAFKEGSPPVPNTYTTATLEDFLTELKSLWNVLQVDSFLTGCRVAINMATTDFKKADRFLVRFDAKKREVGIRGYPKNQLPQAMKDYFLAELDATNNPEMQVVSVSVDSVEKLRIAYPNYYADTDEFLKAMREFISIKT